MGKSIFEFADRLGYNSPFENWVEKDFYVESTKVSKISISFDSVSPDSFEVNEKTLVTLKISGTYQYIGGDSLTVELIESDPNLEFTTKRWTEVEQGWKLMTYVTLKKSGKYSVQFKVNGQQANKLDFITTDVSGKSKYRVLLFGGIDYSNDGSYGSNAKLGKYLETIVQSEAYKIPMQKGDIQIVNSPLFSNEAGGKDIYREILELVKDNFDLKNGTLILYGYSWGGQLLMEFLKYFKESGIKISLLITVDAAKGYFSFSVNNDLTSNVKYNLNMYQTKFYKGKVWSRGWPNEGGKVKNVDLTGEKTPSGEEVIHSNIDDYTLLYATQVILYALQGNFNFYSNSVSDIKAHVKTYASKGY